MSSVLLIQADGKIPNIALMRIAAYHRELGDNIELRRGLTCTQPLFDRPDHVYISTIFRNNFDRVSELKHIYPFAQIGGTGWELDPMMPHRTLEDIGITTKQQNYSIYPGYKQSIGFTQRGCRLRCGFCVVPAKEGAVREENTIADIWRGDPWPRELLLLDNDFFGQPHWRDRIYEIQDGHFKVSFNQGINARFLTDETAAAIASIDYRDDSMKVKRIYTAWDNAKDEARLFRGLWYLVRNGVHPDHIMVYMLIGYWPGETHQDRDYRRQRLRDFGARPYPMAYQRTKELVGFQRWVIGAYDKRVNWKHWQEANYEPRNIKLETANLGV